MPSCCQRKAEAAASAPSDQNANGSGAASARFATGSAFGMPPRAVVEVAGDGTPSIRYPGTDGHDSPWKFYNHLIEGIPEDVMVREYCLGVNWAYVWADSGMGIAYTARGGAPRSVHADLRGTPLRTMAQMAKSWSFEEATLGVAALNAWYSQTQQLAGYDVVYDAPVNLPDGTTRKTDAFEVYRPEITALGNANVTVIGHFPHVLKDPALARAEPRRMFFPSVFFISIAVINNDGQNASQSLQKGYSMRLALGRKPWPEACKEGFEFLGGTPHRAASAFGLFGEGQVGGALSFSRNCPNCQSPHTA